MLKKQTKHIIILVVFGVRRLAFVGAHPHLPASLGVACPVSFAFRLLQFVSGLPSPASRLRWPRLSFWLFSPPSASSPAALPSLAGAGVALWPSRLGAR